MADYKLKEFQLGYKDSISQAEYNVLSPATRELYEPFTGDDEYDDEAPDEDYDFELEDEEEEDEPDPEYNPRDHWTDPDIN